MIIMSVRYKYMINVVEALSCIAKILYKIKTRVKNDTRGSRSNKVSSALTSMMLKLNIAYNGI